MGRMDRERLWARAAGHALYRGEEFVEEHGPWLLGLFLVVAIEAGIMLALGFGAVEILFVSALLFGFGLLVGGLLGRD